MSPLGRFIAFEGGEGAGKSTQAKLLVEALRERGIEVTLTREPGGTPGAEAIRTLLLDPPGEGWGREAEALLFAAARSDHVARVIRPALAAKTWVVCDRFVVSSLAYQGGAGGLGETAIRDLHCFGSGGLMPDRTILLEVGEERMAKRVAARDADATDAIAGRSAHYHRDVARHFRALAHQGGDGMLTIDGGAAPADVHSAIMLALAPLLNGSAA